MATFEIVALDPTTPQLRAPGASDTYSLPRPIVGDNIFPQITTTSATTYTVAEADSGDVIFFTSTSNTAVSLPTAITSLVGFRIWIINASSFNTAIVTVTPVTGTIDGYSNWPIRRGEGVQFITDGTNWTTLAGKRLRMVSENPASGNNRAIAAGDQSFAAGAGANAAGAFSSAIGAITYASSSYSSAFGYGAYTSGSYANAFGCGSGSVSAYASGQGAVSLGGANAQAQDTFAACIGNNTTTYGPKSPNAIAMGYLSTASSNHAIALGGYTSVTSTYGVSIGYSAVTSGYGVSIGVGATSASGAVAIGAGWNFASPNAGGQSSLALGDGTTSALYGVALGPCANNKGGTGRHSYGNGRFSALGDAQANKFIYRRETTSNTAIALTTDNNSPVGSNEMQISANSAMAFFGTIVARQQNTGGTQSAAWKIEGLIRMEGTAATVTLVSSTVTAISNVPGWTVALTTDTTNGCLRINVTGAAATNIRWVGNIDTAEVVY